MDKDIKQIAKEYRDKNGNDRITNKDLLWFMISKFEKLEGRVTKTETRQKIFIGLLPAIIAVSAIIISLI